MFIANNTAAVMWLVLSVLGRSTHKEIMSSMYMSTIPEKSTWTSTIRSHASAKGVVDNC